MHGITCLLNNSAQYGMALGLKTLESGKSFQLREMPYSDIAHFGAKQSGTGFQNACVRDRNVVIDVEIDI
jgi:hypothetical protein